MIVAIAFILGAIYATFATLVGVTTWLVDKKVNWKQTILWPLFLCGLIE